MKILLFSLLILVFSMLLSATLLRAADVSGKWSGTLESKNAEGETKSGPAYMILRQDGNKLTGSGGPNESEQYPIQDGKVEDDRLTFEAEAGGAMMYFDLKVEGDQITGEIKRGKDDSTRTAKLSVKRVAEK